MSKVSSTRVFVTVQASEPYISTDRKIGSVQSDLCISMDKCLLYMFLQQCHTIPNNANASWSTADSLQLQVVDAS